jgi:hypothetical protein
MNLRKFRTFANRFLIGLAKVFGMRLIDEDTKEVLGKALIIPFRGKIHLIGFHSPGDHGFVIPQFDTQERATYWKQSIVFARHPIPDYPHEHSQRDTDASASASRREHDTLVER